MQGLYYLYSMRNLFYCPLLIVFCLIFCACSINTDSPAEESLTLSLPQWPPQDPLREKYPTLSRWQIHITCAEYQKSFYSTESEISIHTKKNRPLCITAVPITYLSDKNECSYFKPAGYLYPAGSSAISPAATWEQGFLAQIMEQLFTEGRKNGLSPLENEYLISTFNWEKAMSTIESKIQADSQIFYNPWLISRTALMDGIALHTFKSSVLNISGATAINCDYICSGIEKADFTLLSSFIPENKKLQEKKQFTVLKNTPILIGDANKFGFFINMKSAKNISLEFIYLPIYIEDI